MIPFREALRLTHITWVLLRHGLDEIILAAHLFRPIRFLKYFSPFYWLTRGRRPTYGVRIRRALEDLGPIYVKFGQILSTRRDLLPDEMNLRLKKAVRFAEEEKEARLLGKEPPPRFLDPLSPEELAAKILGRVSETRATFSIDDLRRLAGGLDGLLVIDEAYVEFIDD